MLLGASQDLIPQLKHKYDVDTLDMVFLDHWKERYLPDTFLLEVSPSPTDCRGCRDALAKPWGQPWAGTSLCWSHCLKPAHTEDRRPLGRCRWEKGLVG